MRALGIDVGAPRKGLDLVVLDDAREPVRVVSQVAVDRLGSLVDELRARRDRDRRAARVGPERPSRLTERLLAQCNLHAFNTPSARTGSGHRVLRVDGDRLPRCSRWRPRTAIGATARVPRAAPRWRSSRTPAPRCSPAACRRGARRRSRGASGCCASQGVPTAELTTADRVDAALCALTGLLALEGKRFAPGDPKEGVIVLPAASLPARPYRPAPAEAHDEATLPLFRECACGDPACHELTRTEFAPGHDAKRKSRLWTSARDRQCSRSRS